MSRRALLQSIGKTAAFFSLVAGAGTSKANRPLSGLQLTPAQTQGPFYPVHPQEDKDLDLTRIQGHSEAAKGQVIVVRGRVLAQNGRAIAGALVDIWQANANGRYRHPRDPNPAALDPDFQGWGQLYSGAEGEYRFKTIFPGAYPAGPDWLRPPHIHFKVSGKGYLALTTQMYFPDQELNSRDLILQQFSLAQQALLIARKNNTELETPEYRFDVVLAQA